MHEMINYITPRGAKAIGLRYSFYSAMFICLLYQLTLTLLVRDADTFNAVLVSVQQQLNIRTVIGYLIFFFIFSYFGKKAGYNILLKNSNPFKVAFFYGLLTTIIVVTYFSYPFISFLISPKGLYLQDEFYQFRYAFLFSVFATFLVIFLGWLLATFRIWKRLGKSKIHNYDLT